LDAKMKNLEQEQEEMRERNQRKKANEDLIEKKPIRASTRTDELDILRKASLCPGARKCRAT